MGGNPQHPPFTKLPAKILHKLPSVLSLIKQHTAGMRRPEKKKPCKTDERARVGSRRAKPPHKPRNAIKKEGMKSKKILYSTKIFSL